MPGQSYKVQWNTEPVLDGWGYDYYWDAQTWIDWHKALAKQWGVDRANEVFITWYHRPSTGAESYDWRTFNTAFKQYAIANKFYDALFSGLGGLIGKVINSGANVVESTTEVVDSTVDAAQETVTNTVDSVGFLSRWMTPILILLGFVALYFTFRKAKNLL